MLSDTLPPPSPDKKMRQRRFEHLTQLAWMHARNDLAETLYLNTAIDVTRPVHFYGIVNFRCNIKCRYCDFWRWKHYDEEMSITEWQSALQSVKDFVGPFAISFSGGEPFIKPGFVDLLTWCHDNAIKAGVTTNGLGLTEKIAKRVAMAHPFNVNISVDAPDAEIQDYVRGHSGLFQRICAGIHNLAAARAEAGADFPIVIKAVVTSQNFRELPALVSWCTEIGASCVNIQPMDRLTPESEEELWIGARDQGALQEIVDRLVAMKRDGAPILNNETTLRLIPNHFRDERAPKETMPCRVGMRNFFIKPQGEVEVCWFFPPIGNIREQSAKDIWYGEKAATIRRQTVECDRLCLFTCLSQKTLKDKVKMGMTLLRSR